VDRRARNAHAYTYFWTKSPYFKAFVEAPYVLVRLLGLSVVAHCIACQTGTNAQEWAGEGEL
jgi:hypothetical protein